MVLRGSAIAPEGNVAEIQAGVQEAKHELAQVQHELQKTEHQALDVLLDVPTKADPGGSPEL